MLRRSDAYRAAALPVWMLPHQHQAASSATRTFSD